LSQFKNEAFIQSAFRREINLFNGCGHREFSQFQAAFIAIILSLGALQVYQEQETLFKGRSAYWGLPACS